MNFQQILFLVTLLTCISCADGDTVSFQLSDKIGPKKDISISFYIVAPTQANIYRTVLYTSGFFETYPVKYQDQLMKSIVSRQYIVVSLVSLIATGANPNITNGLSMAIEWLNSNLLNVFKFKVPGVIPDIMNNFVLMAHSTAAYTVLEHLNSTCDGIKLVVLLNPVDGIDPYGFGKNKFITPGKLLPFATPLLLITNELDSAPPMHGKACAPADISNEIFYDAWVGPKWFINITKYGHIDFFDSLDPWYEPPCATCKGDCNYTDYTTLLQKLINSYDNTVYYGDDCAEGFLSAGHTYRINFDFKHNYMGYNPYKGHGFCQRLPPTEITTNLASE